MRSSEYGTIYEWAGLISAIPPGFVVCDGTKGTPDLRDRFIVGAGDGFDVSDVGGVTVHNHPFTGDFHTHSLGGGGNITAGATQDDDFIPNAAVGTTDNDSALAPYYALIFLQLQR